MHPTLQGDLALANQGFQTTRVDFDRSHIATLYPRDPRRVREVPLRAPRPLQETAPPARRKSTRLAYKIPEGDQEWDDDLPRRSREEDEAVV